MCKCTPEIKTPFCSKGDCQWPVTENVPPYSGSVPFMMHPGTELPYNLIFDKLGGGLPVKVEQTNLQGWYCPNCTKTHSPYINTCPVEISGYQITNTCSSAIGHEYEDIEGKVKNYQGIYVDSAWKQCKFCKSII